MWMFCLALRHMMFEESDTNEEEYLTFQQVKNHRDTHSQDKFSQRYLQNLQFVGESFEKCVVYIGGEGTLASKSVKSGSYMKFAQEEKAAVFALEHRFFGKSMPCDQLTTENYGLLTISQALDDLATFIEFLKKHEKASTPKKDVRFIVVGGSYPGSLSSWFRLHYPHLAVASWSSSAPVNIKNDFPEYDSYIAEQVNKTSPVCLQKTKQIFDVHHNIIKSGTIEEKKQLKKKYGIEDETDDISTLYIINDVLSAIVQYNSRYHLLSPYCSELAKETDPNMYETIYIKTFNALLEIREAKPNDFDLLKATNLSIESKTANSRSWSYMTCNEVGWFQTASGLLRSSLLDLEYFRKVCEKLYGLTTLADDVAVNSRYGGINPRQTRVFFSNGDVDPWSTLGVHYPDESIERRSVVISGESHCSDLSEYNTSNPEFLTKAQDSIISQMHSWIDEVSCNSTCNHGTCIGGRCACDDNWGGSKCDVEKTNKLYFDAAVITAVSVPVLAVVIIIFSSWLFVYRPRKAQAQSLGYSAV